MTPTREGQAASSAHGTLGRIAIVAAVFLAGFNMRASLVATMPLLEILRVDLDTNRTVLGLLTTLPVLLMGLGATLGPRVASRLRLEVGLASSLTLIALAALARFWGGLPVLFATAALIGLAVAIGQPLVMGYTKAHFASQVAVMAGVYAAGINIGAAISARGSLFVYEATGGAWHTSLAIWGVLALLAAVLWIALPTRSVEEMGRPRAPGSVWREGRSWMLALFFTITVVVFYSVLTWLSPIFIDAGWDEEGAATLLSAFALAQLPGTLGFPWLAGRTGSYGLPLAAVVGLSSAGLLLAALAPSAAPWLTVVLLGLGTGGLFPLCLALPLANASDSRRAASLSAMSFTVGYAAGALGPSVVGSFRDVTGGFTAPVVGLAALSVAQLLLIPLVVPRTQPGELSTPP